MATARTPAGTRPYAGTRAVVTGVSSRRSLDRGGHLGVQPHLHLVCPDGLDRARNLDPAPVQFGAASGAHRVRDVRGADRAEQPPGVARLGGQPDLECAKPARGLLGVVEATDVPGRARPLDQVNLL